MKYIVFRLHDEEFPVIFPGHLNHSDVAKAFAGPLSLSPAVPISAGFVRGLIVGEATKESSTLKLKSRPEDTALINLWGRSAL